MKSVGSNNGIQHSNDSGYNSGSNSKSEKENRTPQVAPDPKLSVRTTEQLATTRPKSTSLSSRKASQISYSSVIVESTLNQFKKDFTKIRENLSDASRKTGQKMDIDITEVRYPVACTRYLLHIAPNAITEPPKDITQGLSLKQSAEKNIKAIEQHINTATMLTSKLTDNPSDRIITFDPKVPEHEIIYLIEALATYCAITGDHGKALSYISAGKAFCGEENTIFQIQDAKHDLTRNIPTVVNDTKKNI